MAAKGKFKQFYNSKAWNSCRSYYIAKRINIDGGLCEICQARVGAELDHIEELNESNIDDSNITLNHDNLQWLCHNCHTKKTADENNRVIGFDEDGQPIIRDLP